MSKQERYNRLLPGGIPRWVRCYDNGGATLDRYTVVYTGRYPKGDGRFRVYQSVTMNGQPFWPQGICMHQESQDLIDAPHGWSPSIGRKCQHNPALGRRIVFETLPDDCQQVVLRDYLELWKLEARS